MEWLNYVLKYVTRLTRFHFYHAYFIYSQMALESNFILIKTLHGLKNEFKCINFSTVFANKNPMSNFME